MLFVILRHTASYCQPSGAATTKTNRQNGTKGQRQNPDDVKRKRTKGEVRVVGSYKRAARGRRPTAEDLEANPRMVNLGRNRPNAGRAANQTAPVELTEAECDYLLAGSGDTAAVAAEQRDLARTY